MGGCNNWVLLNVKIISGKGGSNCSISCPITWPELYNYWIQLFGLIAGHNCCNITLILYNGIVQLWYMNIQQCAWPITWWTHIMSYHLGVFFSGINQWCIIECEKQIPAEIGDLGKSCNYRSCYIYHMVTYSADIGDPKIELHPKF